MTQPGLYQRFRYLAKNKAHDVVISRGKYGEGAKEGTPCLVGVTPDGREYFGDTVEEILDAVSGAFSS